MPHPLLTTPFLATPGIILDVRSPSEYAQGHIPSAISFPLFNDEERSQVGTCYKQQGRDRAVELGFAIAGPKSAHFIAAAKALAPDRQVNIHCWRGGMRSGAIAWVLEMAGFRVATLAGGYKAFRQWGRSIAQTPRRVITLGGMTGTGKTAILAALFSQGEQILDLENLANHRGSSYGNLGLPAQPTPEQFENRVAIDWARLDPDRPVWIEAESRRIGACRVPDPIFSQMMESPILQVTRTQSERLAILVEIYGEIAVEELVVATERIRKKLGGLRTQQAIDLLRQSRFAEAFEIGLDYYDKAYLYDLNRRNVAIDTIDISGHSAAESAAILIERSRQVSTAAWSESMAMAIGT